MQSVVKAALACMHDYINCFCECKAMFISLFVDVNLKNKAENFPTEAVALSTG